jgi:hypothetical protein
MRFTPEQLDAIHRDEDYISSDKFRDASQTENFNFIKRDFLFRPGRYRGKIVFPVWANPIKYSNAPLVVGASDFSTGFREIVSLKRFKVGPIFGTNTLNVEKISESIPIGLTNNTQESFEHSVFGNTNHLHIANSSSNLKQNFDGSIYVNFSVGNNEKVRKKLLEVLKTLRGVTYDELEVSDESRIRYLKNLRKFSLVPCPEGNGIDTHRLWETLYMGGTPVITRSNYLPPMINLLPVIQLNSWDELSNINHLESLWHSLNENSYDFKFLRSSFWVDYILKAETNRS